MNIEQVKESAIGRWPGIYASLGIEVGDGRHTACPVCGTEKKHFRLDDLRGTGSWICTCGAGDGWELVQKVLGCNFMEAIEQVSPLIGAIPISAKTKENTITPEKLREIFTSSMPIQTTDPAYKYLTKRGLSKIPGVLRYHPACWESETKQNQKAMLAVFTGADGVAVTMHRTYIDASGDKLRLERPKKILPAIKKMTGGAVRLYEQAEMLGVAEGIETAIAASEMIGIPVWAALSSSLLEGFEPPIGVKTLAIIGDNDTNYAGQKAAYSLAHKLSVRGGISVTVYLPEKPGQDWNDVLVEENKRVKAGGEQ